MKKMYVVLVGLVLCFSAGSALAQNIYLKVYPYRAITHISDFPGSGSSLPSLTDGIGTSTATAQDINTSVELKNYVALSSVQYDLEQTLNIGSQSAGAGAGKIIFNPITITKAVDALSPVLMQYSAQGKPMTLEFIFVTKGNVRYKMLVGLAAVKTSAVSSTDDCGNGCLNIAESYTFEYGQLVVQTYTQRLDGSIVLGPAFGWNRVLNTLIN